MDRSAVHAALADDHRLAIVDALALEDLAAGDLTATLGIPSNLLAHHLGVLERAGVIERRRSEGDGRRAYVSLRLDQPIVAASVGRPRRPSAPRVVFVCTNNSARSPIAASLFASRCAIPVASAGTQPGQAYREGAVVALRGRGLTTVGEGPANVTDVVGPDDLIVTVCDRAHETLVTRPGQSVLHWSIPDPARSKRSDAFERALAEIEPRVARLATTMNEGIRA